MDIDPGAADAQSACAGLDNPPQLSCQFANELCTCLSAMAPESETITDSYVVDGTNINLTPGQASEPWAGPFCVQNDTFVIQGALGWQFIVSQRAN